MASNNIEMAVQEFQSRSFSCSHLTRRRQRRAWRSSISPLSEGPEKLLYDRRGEQLLLILGLLNFYNGKIFTVEQGQKWNLRQALGHGASFAVAEANMPIWSALSHLRYRDINVQKPEEEYNFVDHTNTRWSSKTRVAYKAIGSKEMGMYDVLTELRVLFHTPLQKHPNLVKPLGVAWVMEPEVDLESDGKSEPSIAPNGDKPRRPQQEWPTIVVELAPYGSLLDFLDSSTQRVTMSLRAKLRLCTDVMNAIRALDACGVVHGDIKCENVLLFEGPSANAESWIAKLADFGHSTLELSNCNGEADVSREAFAGTRFYSPPELDDGPKLLTADHFKSIDIWCWGMLLWRVMIDGTEYKNEEGRLIESEHEMVILRRGREFSSLASNSCLEYLRRAHPSDRPLAFQICKILKATLDNDPLSRPRSTRLLEQLEELSGERYVPLPYSEDPPPLGDIPYFELSAQFYDLIAFSTLPRQIFTQLENITDAHRDHQSLHRILQRGLCRFVGFGTAIDPSAGIALVDQAADRGLVKAQAVSVRLHMAFAVPFSASSQEARKEWLIHGALSGSDIAFQDLDRLYPEERHHILVGKRKALQDDLVLPEKGRKNASASSYAHSSSLMQSLLDACREGDEGLARRLVQGGADVNERGRYGESPLHWSIFMSKEALNSLTLELIQKGSEVSHETDFECPLSKYDHFCNVIPAYTTPLEWAILKDDAQLVQCFLEISIGSLMSQLTRYVCFAARYQRIKSLKYFCSIIGLDSLSHFDRYGFSPFYYATRPDIFDRVFRFLPKDDDDEAGNYHPFVAREVGVITTLLEFGFAVQLKPSMLFNCLHMIATVGTSQVLKILLENEKCRRFVNEESVFGGTPLKDAIIRGNKKAFELLLDHGADPKSLWTSKDVHAIHVCAMYPGDVAVEFAQRLLSDDPACLEQLDWLENKPLHTAAEYGHEALARLLTEKGASLFSINYNCLSPLGVAIRARFVGLTRLLMRKHKDRRLIAVAGGLVLWKEIGSWCPGLGKKSLRMIGIPSNMVIEQLSGIEFLLAPGDFSPSPQVKRTGIPRAFNRTFGCCDEPFSKISMKVLKVILEEYYLDTRPSILQPFHVLRRATRALYIVESGLYWTVRMGNQDALKIIIKSKIFRPDLRDLIDLAFCQLQLGSDHVAPRKKRQDIIRYLEGLDKTAFDEKRKARFENKVFGCLWRVYYRFYGDIERAQYEQCNLWRFGSPICWSANPRILEFRQWYHARFSLYISIYVALWGFLTPFIVFFALMAKNPTFALGTSKTVHFSVTVFMLNITYLWPKTVRVISVFYDHFIKKGFSDRDFSPLLSPHGWLQIFLCAAAFVLSGYTCMLLGALDPNPNERNPTPNETNILENESQVVLLSPRENSILKAFEGLTSFLIAWIVLTQMIVQLAVLWTRISHGIVINAAQYGLKVNGPLLKTESVGIEERTFVFNTNFDWFAATRTDHPRSGGRWPIL